MSDTLGEWKWWAGSDEDSMTIGPCETRQIAIDEAANDELGDFEGDDGVRMLGFHVVEARKDGLRLAEWISAHRMLERARETVSESDRASEDDYGDYFSTTTDQEKDLVERVNRACDEWQAEHKLVFETWSFSAMRNAEYVTMAAEDQSE